MFKTTFFDKELHFHLELGFTSFHSFDFDDVPAAFPV
jgi:hypothetical protein